MTRFVLFALIFSFPALAAKKPKCQGDLSGNAPAASQGPPPTSQLFDDLPKIQKEIWALERKGQLSEATRLRHRLEDQVALNRRKELAATISRHRLYRSTKTSFVLLRDGVGGFKEIIAYKLNEKLGRPIKIPATASQLDGSLQLWMLYDHGDELLSENEDQALSAAIEADVDLFLFNFLMSNTDQNSQNIIMDPDHGIIVFDFGAGLRFSAQNFIYYSKPKAQRTKALEEINLSDVETILREKLATAKFGWRRALEGLDLDDISGLIRQRVGPIEAREFEARVCLLRAILNGGDLALCSAL